MYTYDYHLRFNAEHDTSSSETNENSHLHTFQLLCRIKQDTIDCRQMECELNDILSQYKGIHLNKKMKRLPTIENIGEMLFYEIQDRINGILLFLEISDKPTQVIRIGMEE